MGAGVRQIKNAAMTAIQGQISRGRDPVKSLRIVICWQFNEFFKGAGSTMKNIFPFDILPDVQELVRNIKPLNAIVILGAQGHTWNVPLTYDSWVGYVRQHFTDHGILWIDGTRIFGPLPKADE